MSITLLIIGVLCVILGFLGAFVPVIPGPIVSWLALLCLYYTDYNIYTSKFLVITAIVAIAVLVLDYIIPSLATKKLGGTKYGVWGSTFGLLIGLFLGPLGIIIGPFAGAYIGELLNDSKNTKRAMLSALGSFIGFLTSTVLKAIVSIVFGYYFFTAVF